MDGPTTCGMGAEPVTLEEPMTAFIIMHGMWERHLWDNYV